MSKVENKNANLQNIEKFLYNIQGADKHSKYSKNGLGKSDKQKEIE